VEHGVSGLLVEAGNPEALADAIAEFTVDAALRRRLGQAGRKRILERFSIEALLPRWKSFYHELKAIVPDRY